MAAPILHMICGKVAAGKTTLAARLAAAPSTVLIVQDAWMSKLYVEELVTIADYVRLIPRLRAAMGPHIAELLRTGLSVVLDWPANTRASRAWMREIFESAGAAHRLHMLELSDEACLQRLRARNAAGEHEYQVSDEEFAELTRYFEPVAADEGFDVVIVHPETRSSPR